MKIRDTGIPTARYASASCNYNICCNTTSIFEGVLTFGLLPYPAKKGFFLSATGCSAKILRPSKHRRMSIRHRILNSSGFLSITWFYNDDMLHFLSGVYHWRYSHGSSSYLPFQSVNERVWIEEDRAIRETNLALSNRLQILLGHTCLTDCPAEEVKNIALKSYSYIPGRQVHDMVAVGSDLGKELSNSGLCPVPAYHWQDVPQHVRLGDRAVNVRYHHLTEFGSIACDAIEVTYYDNYSRGPCLCASKGRCGICTLLCPTNKISIQVGW